MVGALHLGGTARRISYVVAGLVVCAAIVWFGRGLMPADTTPTHSAPAQNFVWSDRVPLTKAMLTQWLNAHGANYATWAKRHPAAAAKLAP